MDKYLQFKCVLEYFVAHLEWVQNRDTSGIGYSQYISPLVHRANFKTTGQGYKGMLHQPDPEEKPDMYKGIVAIRDLHLSALRDYDFSCADEMLYPDNHRYLSDLLSYVAVGARSVENQQHRLTASGLAIPVGMKNPTSGDLSIMMNCQHGTTVMKKIRSSLTSLWKQMVSPSKAGKILIMKYLKKDLPKCRVHLI